MKSIAILGVEVDRTTTDDVFKKIQSRLASKQKTFIVTINTEFIMYAQQNAEFRSVLNQADIRVADGIGLLWAARVVHYRPRLPFKVMKKTEVVFVSIALGFTTFLSQRSRYSILPEQITGVDLSMNLAKWASEQQHPLFLLGAQEGVATAAARQLQKKYPAVKIAGTFAGNGAMEGDVETLPLVQQAAPQILLVAYGAPKQEFWIKRNFEKIPALLAIGVGGTFTYLSGQIRRAPNWMRSLGLEWLYRLASEPWRWRRQMALPRFILSVIGEKISSI